jgi:hypothetical protein
MSAIVSSGTLTYSSSSSGGTFTYTDNVYGSLTVTFPITIGANNVTVTFGSNFPILDTSYGIIVKGNYVTIDGANCLLDFTPLGTASSYDGLVQNGSDTQSGYNNCVVKNICCINTRANNYIFAYITQTYFGKDAMGCIITNCGVVANYLFETGICGSFSNCSISNCYCICNSQEDLGPSVTGVICDIDHVGDISNCYVICGGDLYAGVCGPNQSGNITNCYVICGGSIAAAGIVAENGSGTISKCYVICCGNIYNYGITSRIGATVTNCYVSYNTITNSSNIFAPTGSSITSSVSSQSSTPSWTSTGAGYLNNNGSVWTNLDPTTNKTPWLLTSFNKPIVAPLDTTNSPSATIPLNTYGQTFNHVTVYSGKPTGSTTSATTGAGGSVDVSGIQSNGSYTLGLYAYDLLSELPSFILTNGTTTMRTAFNLSSGSAATVIPYTYSISSVTLLYSNALDCFLEGTKILTDKGYVNIEKLTKEHLVITLEGKKRIYKIGKCTMDNLAVQEKIKDQLYVYSNSDYQQITQGDLVITGGHSILVDSFENEQQEEETKKILGEIFLTKNKLRLPVCLDKRSRVYEEKGEKTIYHIALEHIHYDCNYGIYANGLLVESCSQNYIDNKSDNLVCIDI